MSNTKMLPIEEVAAKLREAANHYRLGMEALRRDLKAQAPDDFCEAMLATFDNGEKATRKAMAKALEVE